MASEQESSDAQTSFPAAGWLLEGGNDPWDQLVEVAARYLDELVTGGILEIISWVPGIELDIAGWCDDAGHRLLHVLSDGQSTRLRVEKGKGPRRNP